MLEKYGAVWVAEDEGGETFANAISVLKETS